MLLRAGEPQCLDELRPHLLQLLPEPMVPSAYVPVTSWPLSPNGRGRPPGAAASGSRLAHANTAVGAFPTQPSRREILARIWSRVLRVPAIGPQDSFFALGDSILAIQVLGQARQAGLHLSLRLLFQHPTLAALARAIPAGARPPLAPQKWSPGRWS